ncbi:MAG TPA: DUF4386 domain-containing protein [Gemmatimonadales bacterium]|jgi:hypothetical protein
MTRRTNARVAGVAYLLYIAAAFPSMILMGRATAGDGMPARIANLAQHAFDVRLAMVLSLIGCFCALVLGVTLYAITRVQDRDLAMLAMICRVAEGITGAASLPPILAFLSVVAAGGANESLGAFVLDDSVFVAATFFAVGSTIFSWLLLKGRMVPIRLAWLGVIGSALIAMALSLESLQAVGSAVVQILWIPVAVFEIVLAVWLIAKGVTDPTAEVANAE